MHYMTDDSCYPPQMTFAICYTETDGWIQRNTMLTREKIISEE